MTLYELTKEDIADLLLLITAPSLTIQAHNARRLAELQHKLSDAKPSAEVARLREELEVTRGALEATERQRQEWIARASVRAGCTHVDDDMAERAPPSTNIPL